MGPSQRFGARSVGKTRVGTHREDYSLRLPVARCGVDSLIVLLSLIEELLAATLLLTKGAVGQHPP